MRILVVAFLALSLGGCAVASLAGTAVSAGVDVAATAVSATADVAGAAADTVTGSGESKKQKN
jgi:hypothetical protein